MDAKFVCSVEETYRGLVQAVREGDVKVIEHSLYVVHCDVEDTIDRPFR